ncbi:MAG: DUF72 domain-containing protein [Dehalococcoidales bacterium]|nr:DUF72 domain-containing protein [Dehalococcoidales bacterium]
MAKETKFYIGTSGWSYPEGEGTWKGYFYPPGNKNELGYYSQFFNTVEVNSSFYRPPNPGFVANWVKRTPPGFIFTVKLWQKFTHPEMYMTTTGTDAEISYEDIDMFRRSLEPLVKAEKMGALLAQFPPGFKNDEAGKEVLDAVERHFGQYRLAVELRHKSWSDDPSTEKFLREHNIAWVNNDEPKFSQSIAADLPSTADFSYFRFHGRNAINWWNGNNETRYKYLYSPIETLELTAKVQAASEHTPLTFAYFNNHWKAYAPRNANDMVKALQMPFAEIPTPDVMPLKLSLN